MGRKPIFRILHFFAPFRSEAAELGLPAPDHAEIRPSNGEIDVLSDSRIGVAEKSRNLPNIQLLILEGIRKEMSQRMMRDVWNFRFLARRL